MHAGKPPCFSGSAVRFDFFRPCGGGFGFVQFADVGLRGLASQLHRPPPDRAVCIGNPTDFGVIAMFPKEAFGIDFGAEPFVVTRSGGRHLRTQLMERVCGVYCLFSGDMEKRM